MTDTAFSITFMSGAQDGKVLTWTPPDAEEFILSIGRRKGCEVFIESDPQVSRLHARLIYDPTRNFFYLEDLGSRNGTILNDRRLQGRAPIQPGTLFRVGQTWLRLDVAKPMAADDDDTLDRYDYPF